MAAAGAERSSLVSKEELLTNLLTMTGCCPDCKHGDTMTVILKTRA